MDRNIWCNFCEKRATADYRRIATAEDFRHFQGTAGNYKEQTYICLKCKAKVLKSRKKRGTQEDDSNQNLNPPEHAATSTPIGKRRSETEPKVYKRLKFVTPKRKRDKEYSKQHVLPKPVKSPATIKLPVPESSGSHKQCVFCSGAHKLRVIKSAIRTQIFIRLGIIVPEGTRCCDDHITDEGNLHPDVTEVLVKSSDTTFNRTRLLQLLHDVRNTVTADAKNTGLSIEKMTDGDCYNFTGLTKENFEQLYQTVKKEIRTTRVRSARTALLLLLVKLRTGLSIQILGSLFQIPIKLAVSRAIHTARRALMKTFVPKNLGFGHITREDFIDKHTRSISQRLFADGNKVAVVVLDGTYIYIQKSGNYKFQRRSYSLHKHRHLVKPMMIVGTDGYILSVLGPYLADGKNSDAHITEQIMNENKEEIRDWLKPEDVAVVDRGFRDSIELLSELGFQSAMPHFLEKGRKQHTTLEANESRMVTKIRWVVESANGRIKHWRALDHVMPNSQIPYIGDYVQIVCALCNAFRPPLIRDTSNDDYMATKMLNLLHSKNNLQEQVQTNGWERKTKSWVQLDSTVLPDFPRLTDEQLTDITLGVYQLKQARSYTQEHLDDQGSYEVLLHKECSDVVRINIKSRHTESKSYSHWIRYDDTDIKGWYCQCRSGARVIGCCAHIASSLWYLGYQRHLQKDFRGPAEGIEQHIEDCADEDWEATTGSESEDDGN